MANGTLTALWLAEQTVSCGVPQTKIMTRRESGASAPQKVRQQTYSLFTTETSQFIRLQV